jgi:hypothetical protein
LEYAIVHVVHPEWLSLQLPKRVAALIQYDTRDLRDRRAPGRGISFFTRGPGIVRVVASYPARDIVPVETVRNRYIAPARVSKKLLFSLPAPVQRHLGLATQVRGPNGARATDDGIVWFAPAPEYFEFRAQERSPKGWNGPSPGGFAHVYIARSVVPLVPDLDELTALENRIESEDWRPRFEALGLGRRNRR